MHVDEVKDGRAVLDRLLQIDAAYAASIPDQSSAERINHHRIFLLLYYYSTVRWLEFAEISKFPVIVNKVVVEFFGRYRGSKTLCVPSPIGRLISNKPIATGDVLDS